MVRGGLIFPIGLVMMTALLIRLYQLGTLSLWIDEAYSAWFSSRDWRYLWSEVPQFETHPSFYYSLLKLWRIFGSDEFTLRLLSVLINVATIPLVSLAARLCGDQRTGQPAAILAAILFSCSATQMQAAQDARPYALMTLGMATALASTIAVMTAGARANAPLRQILTQDYRMAFAFTGIGVGIALLAWSHNFGPVIGLTLGACLLGFWMAQGTPRGLLVNLLVSAAIAVLLYAPNIPIILMQTQSIGSQGFWLGRPGVSKIFVTMREMPLGHSGFNGSKFVVMGYLSVLTAIVGLVGIIYQKTRIPLAVPITLAVMAIAPALISFIISWIGQPIFLFRTFQVSQVPILIGLSFMPAAIQRYLPPRQQWLASLLPLLLAATALWSFQIANKRPDHANYRFIIQEIAAESSPEIPKLVIYPPALELPYLYYEDLLDVPLNIVSVPSSYPARDPSYHYPAGGGGNPSMTPQMISKLMHQLKGDTTIWIVTRNVHLYDPDDLFLGGLVQDFPCLIDGRLAGIELRSRAAPDGSCL